MSHKTSPARRAAFFDALRVTGNQSLACERAKVSRAWVQLQRSIDPQFKADVAAAVAEAKVALSQRSGSSPEHSPQSGRQPPRGWGHLDSEELVVKGTGGSGGGKRVQIARARLKQWTPRVERRFLTALLATCNVTAACAEVGMTPAGAYAHRKRWPRFAELWDEAIAEGFARIEIALLENGLNLFGETELPPDTPLRGMDAAMAIRLLHMHKHGVLGIGKAPGKCWRPPPTLAEVKPGILRKLSVWQAGREIAPEVRAADARAYAARRGWRTEAGEKKVGSGLNPE